MCSMCLLYVKLQIVGDMIKRNLMYNIQQHGGGEAMLTMFLTLAHCFGKAGGPRVQLVRTILDQKLKLKS